MHVTAQYNPHGQAQVYVVEKQTTYGHH
jgi:hypothetical protein